MKTIQVGDGKVKVIQFEFLDELQKFFSEKEIVDNFNFAYKFKTLNAYKIIKRSKEVKK